MKLIDIDVIVSARTPAAVLVRVDEDAKGAWLPLSQIEIEPKPGSKTIHVVTLPRALAQEKGLI